MVCDGIQSKASCNDTPLFYESERNVRIDCDEVTTYYLCLRNRGGVEDFVGNISVGRGNPFGYTAIHLL